MVSLGRLCFTNKGMRSIGGPGQIAEVGHILQHDRSRDKPRQACFQANTTSISVLDSGACIDFEC